MENITTIINGVVVTAGSFGEMADKIRDNRED